MLKRRPKRSVEILRARLRTRAGAFVVDNFFYTASRLGRLHPQADPRRHGVEVLRNIPYRNTGSPDHLLDIYRPVGRPGPFPVVFYMHGGGFRILSKDTHWVMGLAYARRGTMVVNINYRLAPRHPFPAAVQDACAAFTWLAEHARAYGGDLSRLAFAGESAGGNLTCAMTVATCYERPEPWAKDVFATGHVPRVALPACGLLQVTDVERFARRKKLPAFLMDRLTEVTDAYLRGVVSRRPGDLDLADPLVVFERGDRPARPLPSFFIPCGTRDILLDDSRRLDAALRKLGATSELRIYPGQPHAFHAIVFQPAARQCWRDKYAFLDQHL